MGAGKATAHQALKTDPTPYLLIRIGRLIFCQVWLGQLRTKLGAGPLGKFFDLQLDEAGPVGGVLSTSDDEWKTVRGALPTKHVHIIVLKL